MIKKIESQYNIQFNLKISKNKSSEDNKNSTQEENQLKTLFQKQLMIIIGTPKYYISTRLGRCHCTQVEWILHQEGNGMLGQILLSINEKS